MLQAGRDLNDAAQVGGDAGDHRRWRLDRLGGVHADRALHARALGPGDVAGFRGVHLRPLKRASSTRRTPHDWRRIRPRFAACHIRLKGRSRCRAVLMVRPNPTDRRRLLRVVRRSHRSGWSAVRRKRLALTDVPAIRMFCIERHVRACAESRRPSRLTTDGEARRWTHPNFSRTQADLTDIQGRR